MKITTEQDLVDLLKENLRVEVTRETPYHLYSEPPPDDIVVKVYYKDTLLSESISS